MLRMKPSYDFGYAQLSDLSKEFDETKSVRRLIIDCPLANIEIGLLKKIIKASKFIECSNYEDALKINEIINETGEKCNDKTIILTDDHEMKDRSYIDTTIFKNIEFKFPHEYTMWGVKFDDNSPQKKLVTEVERITSMIANDFPEKLTDVEKILLICNYIQRYSEYIWFKTDKVYRDKEEFDLIDNKDEAPENSIVLDRIKEPRKRNGNGWSAGRRNII